jgi:hypothetical protein
MREIRCRMGDMEENRHKNNKLKITSKLTCNVRLDMLAFVICVRYI